MVRSALTAGGYSSLNESPSEKEGKSPAAEPFKIGTIFASMKVPPKRKGNSTEA